jgi:hypothetical protein
MRFGSRVTSYLRGPLFDPLLALRSQHRNVQQKSCLEILLDFLIQGLRIRKLFVGPHQSGLLAFENAVKIRPGEEAIRTHALIPRPLVMPAAYCIKTFVPR